jgi:hypothetical protein
VNQYPNKPPAVRLEARTLQGDRPVVSATPDDLETGRWVVGHADGRQVSVATLVEAAMTMVRWLGDRPVSAETTTLPGGIIPGARVLADACRTLGAAGPATAADILDCAPLILTGPQRAAVLAQLGHERSAPIGAERSIDKPRRATDVVAATSAPIGAEVKPAPQRTEPDVVDAHTHMPNLPPTSPPRPGDRQSCQVCRATLVWTVHGDRDQAGWLAIPAGLDQLEAGGAS